jgi:hypothetical protein
VSRRQRRGLVEEEQLAIAARRHHGAPAALEGEDKDQPGVQTEGSNNTLVRIVEQAAIAQPAAPRVDGDQSTKRIDPVLQRHGSA